MALLGLPFAAPVTKSAEAAARENGKGKWRPPPLGDATYGILLIDPALLELAFLDDF